MIEKEKGIKIRKPQISKENIDAHKGELFVFETILKNPIFVRTENIQAGWHMWPMVKNGLFSISFKTVDMASPEVVNVKDLIKFFSTLVKDSLECRKYLNIPKKKEALK